MFYPDTVIPFFAGWIQGAGADDRAHTCVRGENILTINPKGGKPILYGLEEVFHLLGRNGGLGVKILLMIKISGAYEGGTFPRHQNDGTAVCRMQQGDGLGHRKTPEREYEMTPPKGANTLSPINLCP